MSESDFTKFIDGAYQGLKCQHWDEELPLVVDVLQAIRPQLIVEAGTAFGGFAAFLADTIKPWGGRLVTIDHVIKPGVEDACLGRSNIWFLRADLMGAGIRSLLVDLFAGYRPNMFYADGPHKRPEFFQFGQLADLVGVHDYGSEVKAADVTAWAAEHKYEFFMAEKFEALEAIKGVNFVSRFLIKQR